PERAVARPPQLLIQPLAVAEQEKERDQREQEEDEAMRELRADMAAEAKNHVAVEVREQVVHVLRIIEVVVPPGRDLAAEGEMPDPAGHRQPGLLHALEPVEEALGLVT